MLRLRLLHWRDRVNLQKMVDEMGILKPYSFVLEDDDKESIGELYIADDDTIIIDTELMADLDKELAAIRGMKGK